jgi:tRNA modification GTPase
MTTIFALSSGLPPAAITIVRISGPGALSAARALAGALPGPREARVRALRHPESGELLDRGLVLVFPGPSTATGEDLVELHLHGGRAVVAAIEAALAELPGLRRAEPGEFTRRALANGRIDLAEAEGLGDLLSAETELQRRAAMASADGTLSRRVAGWRDALLTLAARLEAAIDFSDEDDVATDSALVGNVSRAASIVADDIATVLNAPPVDRLRDGIRIVLAGPPNSGKSTLLNAMVRRDAAIVSPVAGTTRDRIEISVSRSGLPFVITDTAGLRDSTEDEIERIGIDRAEEAMATADLVVWLGDQPPSPTSAELVWLHARGDQPGRAAMPEGPEMAVSGLTGAGVEELWDHLAGRAFDMVPHGSDVALNERQARHCREAAVALRDIDANDELIVADSLRRAIAALSRVTGDTGVESMLDALFARFCIGK